LSSLLKLPKNKSLAGADKLIAVISERFGVRSWEVPEDFPLGLAERLKALDSGIRLLPQKSLFPERQIKTAAEAEFIRAGVELAEAGLAQALRLLAEAEVNAAGFLCLKGKVLTAEQLQGAINCRIAELGGVAARTITAPGLQGSDPHQAGSGPLAAGVPIVIDIFPRVSSTGYFGDLTRTVVKGRATPVVRRAFKAVRAAQSAAIKLARPGVKPAELHETAARIMAEAGFETDTAAKPPRGFIHGLGHGLGLEIHEAPRVAPRCEEPLKAGNVITIEPGLYFPEWGGIRLEDVLLITPDGSENFTTADINLESP
jgi:Xaa-Pro aminopeptidase